jgi:hypothetical protein
MTRDDDRHQRHPDERPRDDERPHHEDERRRPGGRDHVPKRFRKRLERRRGKR